MGRYFSIERFWERVFQVTPYIKLNLEILLVSMAAGTLLGILVAVLRIRKIPVIHQLLGVYISFMRGTPLLVQIFIVYFGGPLLAKTLLHVNISRWPIEIFVVTGIILNEGAFLGEIFRSSILAVPAVQSEAAYSIGMTGGQTFFRIVMPQALKVAVPQYGVDLIAAFQNTSLIFTFGVVDILGRAKTLGNASGHMLEGYLVVAICFIVFSLLLKILFLQLDKCIHFGEGGAV